MKKFEKEADALALKNFCKEVNAIGVEHAKKLNKMHAEGKLLFGTMHFDYPVEMLELYYREGYTAEKAYKAIMDEAGA